jgi:nicotinate-nucleotide adenylyltransferase
MENIGLLGGSFNPITSGHIEIARYALNLVDEVILIPCNNHSWGKSLIDFKHRFKMCQLAIDNRMSVKDYELRYKLSGDTFSLIKILKQSKLYAESNLFFIIGMDEANNFKDWKNYLQLCELVNFIVVQRPGVLQSEWVKRFFKDPHIILPPSLSVPKVSSSDIRRDLSSYYITKRTSSLLRHNLNQEVFKYIIRNDLYKKT